MQPFHPFYVDRIPYIVATVELEEEPGLMFMTQLTDCTEDVDRHFAELGTMEAAGVTYVNIGHPPTTPQQMLDFIAAFGETYIKP